MLSDSFNHRNAKTAGASSASGADFNADAATERFANKGWTELDEMADQLGWRHSQLTAVLRWLKQESPIYVVESKVSRGVVKVRITKATADSKKARQLSTEIVAQLAKLYSNLKHTDRNREKLANDVRTIASRIAPFLENREFQIQCNRFKQRLKDPQQETQMEAGTESSNPSIDPAQTFTRKPNVSSPAPDSPRFASFDRRSLRRLILIATIVVVGLLITVFLTTTFLHAIELLSQYVERINSQLQL